MPGIHSGLRSCSVALQADDVGWAYLGAAFLITLSAILAKVSLSNLKDIWPILFRNSALLFSKNPL
jgi:hypothetical protein